MTSTQVNLICACGYAVHHNCPHTWDQGSYLQPSAPGRHTVDTITDPVLHRLYDDRDMYARDWEAARVRAEKAEAALARARTELDRIAALPTVDRDETRANTFSTGANWTVRLVRAALDEDGQPVCTCTLQERCAACGPEPEHIGGNAEDCPACASTNPDYPFICPGPPSEEPHAECVCPPTQAGLTLCSRCPGNQQKEK